ncbi:hypothetical protein ACLVWU_13415 [Bdellovibrio sp. HCB290]|uniref:hypothetical protein n=1 Tax=Bdellovibrio sp. HCB290 TaxID=3394356 RepID=UPI0039B4A649
MRLFLCCLMLGLTIANYGTPVMSEFASTSPKALWQGRAGIYKLVAGADNCPTSVTWIEQCRGFSLVAMNGDIVLSESRICDIGKVQRPAQGEFGKMQARATIKDQYVHNKAELLFGVDRLPLSEDIVIFDSERRSFNWEHISRGTQNHSCLYSK